MFQSLERIRGKINNFLETIFYNRPETQEIIRQNIDAIINGEKKKIEVKEEKNCSNETGRSARLIVDGASLGKETENHESVIPKEVEKREESKKLSNCYRGKTLFLRYLHLTRTKVLAGLEANFDIKEHKFYEGIGSEVIIMIKLNNKQKVTQKYCKVIIEHIMPVEIATYIEKMHNCRYTSLLEAKLPQPLINCFLNNEN